MLWCGALVALSDNSTGSHDDFEGRTTLGTTTVVVIVGCALSAVEIMRSTSRRTDVLCCLSAEAESVEMMPPMLLFHRPLCTPLVHPSLLTGVVHHYPRWWFITTDFQAPSPPPTPVIHHHPRWYVVAPNPLAAPFASGGDGGCNDGDGCRAVRHHRATTSTSEGDTLASALFPKFCLLFHCVPIARWLSGIFV